MKEFAKGGRTPQEQFFGYRLSSARMVVDCAFGQLKARFGILRQPIDLCLENAVTTIHACFILHNFCEMHNDTMPNELTTAVQMYDRDFQPLHGPDDGYAVFHNEQAGKENRQIFMKYFE